MISNDKHWEKRKARIKSVFAYADTERNDLLMEVEKFRYKLQKILELAKMKEDWDERWFKRYIIRIIEGDGEDE